jgi:hypothetical protein
MTIVEAHAGALRLAGGTVEKACLRGARRRRLCGCHLG